VRKILLLLAVLVFTVVGFNPKAQADSGISALWDGVSSNMSTCLPTAQQTFVPMPDMSVTFTTLPQAPANSALIFVSVEPALTLNQSIALQIVIDDTPLPFVFQLLPIFVVDLDSQAPESVASMSGFTFISPIFPSGSTHTIRVDWRVSFDSTATHPSVCVLARSLVILHN